ncbi:MAG: response regulator [Candidatus Margulisbacteria bacterium]|jgi:CheY-like chemotaxis protein|nr:response regulator [Candidatus Margulisiibacteriota bacterium]
MANILIVDDEVNIIKMFKLTLEMLGHTVRSAAQGRAALAVYAQNADNIDLVISDLTMQPDMSGWELCAALKDRVPVALTSGELIDENFLEKVLAAGAVGFLNKPADYAPDTLKKKLAEFLAQAAELKSGKA